MTNVYYWSVSFQLKMRFPCFIQETILNAIRVIFKFDKECHNAKIWHRDARKMLHGSARPYRRRRRRKNILCFTAPTSLRFYRIKKVSARWLNQSSECIKLRITTNRTLTAHAHYNGTPCWRCIYVLNRLLVAHAESSELTSGPKNTQLGSLEFPFSHSYSLTNSDPLETLSIICRRMHILALKML